MSQKEHEDIRNATHDLNIVVVAENIRTPENLGMIIRVSEAFGVKKVLFIGDKTADFSTKAKRAARHADQLLMFEFISDSDRLFEQLQHKNYRLIALEYTSSSQPITELKMAEKDHLAIVIGSERKGISARILKKMQSSHHIKMYGKNSSINVVNALSIALYQLVK